VSWSILPPSYERSLGHAVRIELATDRRIRERNKIRYRLAHWPIWIWVFFIAPGPLTFDLFAHGFDARMALWLCVVLVATGLAGWAGKLPGVEPRPYIIRFTEDRPNPLYRRVCYTLAWSEVIAFAVLNLAGLIVALVTGVWRLREFYEVAYFPIVVPIWILGALGLLPRVKRSTQGEGHERRYFYGSVWAVCIAQPILGLLWKAVPRGRPGDALKLIVFVGILVWVGNLSRRGLLPRTRPIVPGELAVSD
jgi:predicted small integral membrane protein